MKVQRYERHGTPLNERICYFLEFVFWLVVMFFVLAVLLLAHLKISELFVPTGRYTGHPAFAEDERLCLQMRPKRELHDCLSEYGWFDKPAVIQWSN